MHQRVAASCQTTRKLEVQWYLQTVRKLSDQSKPLVRN
jgi:hypothetical protein